MHKILCIFGLHDYKKPYVREHKREVRCDPRPVMVTDYAVRKTCKVCSKDKLVIRVDCELK
jgi:hypothetical protein